MRKEDGERLFDTLGSDLIFKDQYLELSSAMPQEANIYGLGEHVGSFRRKTEGEGSRITIGGCPSCLVVVLARAHLLKKKRFHCSNTVVFNTGPSDALTPQDENLYGAHPFYMEMRNGCEYHR